MIDFGERKDLLVIFIIGILLVVGFMIFSFIIIWMPKTEEEFQVGKISNEKINITSEYKATQYIKKLSDLFSNNDYEKLYSFVAKDYITYNNFTIDSLKEKLTKIKLNGQEIYLENCTSKKLNGYNEILVVTVRGKNNDIAANLVIREKSPRNFDFAFDEFILYDTPLYEKSAENVKLDILYKYYKTNQMIIKFKITNNNDSDIILDYNGSGLNCFALNNYEGTIKASSKIANDKITIQPGVTREYEIMFDTTSVDLTRIRGLTLNNVKIGNKDSVGIFYSFY